MATIGGVSFQPLSGGANGANPARPPQNTAAVQEAVRILSLRLPRVVGAQAISPQSLLDSSGSNGSRVDSVVNQVLARFFPTAGAQQPAAQSFGMAPSFDPNQGAEQPTFSPEVQYGNPFMSGLRREAPSIDRGYYPGPRVIVDAPDDPFAGSQAARAPRPTFDSSPTPIATSMIAPLPSFGGYAPKEPDRPYEI